MVPVVLVTALPMKFTGTWMSEPPASWRETVTVRPLVRCISWMRGKSDCGRAKEIFTGWISLRVTSGVALVEAVEALTMLPGWIRIAPVLPLTGARMVVNSTLRRADSTAALASR